MAGGFTVTFTIDTHGPLFNGMAEEALDKYAKEVPKLIAQKGKVMIKDRLHEVLRHPTGKYESSVRIYANGTDTRTIVGDGLIYGPWLEGVGSRNSPVTRFPGYFVFRQVSSELQSLAVGIAEKLLHEKYLKRMN